MSAADAEVAAVGVGDDDDFSAGSLPYVPREVSNSSYDSLSGPSARSTWERSEHRKSSSSLGYHSSPPMSPQSALRRATSPRVSDAPSNNGRPQPPPRPIRSARRVASAGSPARPTAEEPPVRSPSPDRISGDSIPSSPRTRALAELAKFSADHDLERLDSHTPSERSSPDIVPLAALSIASSPRLEGGASESDTGFFTAEEDELSSLRGGAGRDKERPGRTSSRSDEYQQIMSLPTILDNSPVITRNNISLLGQCEEDPVRFGPAPLGGVHHPNAAQSQPDPESESDTTSPPRSVRQLVRHDLKASRSRSREFTPADEKRLSDRVAQRRNDGLGLSLDMFDAPANGFDLERAAHQRLSRPAAGGPLTPTSPMELSESPTTYPFPALLIDTRSGHDAHTLARTDMPLSNSVPRLDTPPLASPFDVPIPTAPSFSRQNSYSNPRVSHSASFHARPSSPSINIDSTATSPAPSTPGSARTSSPADEPRRSRKTSSMSSSNSMRRLSGLLNIATTRSRTSSLQDLQELGGGGAGGSTGAQISSRRSIRTVASDDSYKTATEGDSPGLHPQHSPSGRSHDARPSLAPSPRLQATASPALPSSAFGSLSPSFASNSSLSPSSMLMTPSPLVTRTWRSMMSAETYDSMLARHGPIEMRRQEVIWELCETESSFVDSFKGVIELFALPLQTAKGRWIKGVPVPVSRLFDWAADIVFLHSQISDALQHARQVATAIEDEGEPIVSYVAAALQPFVTRLDVHQPYLVRFDAVTKLIEHHVGDANSDFGEFIRQQSALPECRGLSLASYLLKPVQRLMKYPLFLQQLSELTPPAHPDHNRTLSLLASMDFQIRVLQEVKTREDDYEQVKELQKRLRGLPSGFLLARRDRRLVARGDLRRVHVSERDRIVLDMDERMRSSSMRTDETTPVLRLSSKPAPPRPHSGVSDVSASSHRSTRISDDFVAWSTPMTTPELGGKSTGSSLSNGPTKDDIAQELRPLSLASSVSSNSGSEDSGLHRSAANETHDDTVLPGSAFSESMPAKRAAKRLVKTKAKESAIHVFVFSDLVITAVRTGDSGRWTPKLGSSRRQSLVDDIGALRVVETVGVARVMGVADLSGKTEHEDLIRLDLLPITSSTERLVPLALGSYIPLTTSIYLTLPSAGSPASSAPSTPGFINRPRSNGKSNFKQRVLWLQLFEQCFRYTDRCLSQSTALNAFTAPVTNQERQSSEGALAAGRHRSKTIGSATALSPGAAYQARFLPAPDNEPDAVEARAEAAAEREERAWWSSRLEQVKREMESHREQHARSGDAKLKWNVRRASR